MLTSEFRPWHVPVFLAKYAYLTVTRRPVLVHFEVTMRCNAHCGFCDYWKTDPSAKETELKSFAECASFFNPMVITFTGGEPTLRRDLEDLISSVNRAVRLKYMTLITHGAMLSPERARSIWKAGISQFNISLDYLDERHDNARGIPGLGAKIMRTVPRMREIGITGVRFNTVIKRDNLDQLMPIVRRAREIGCGVNFSCYTDNKNGNADGVIDARMRASSRTRSKRFSHSSVDTAVSSPTRITISSRFRATSAVRSASRAAPECERSTSIRLEWLSAVLTFPPTSTGRSTGNTSR